MRRAASISCGLAAVMLVGCGSASQEPSAQSSPASISLPPLSADAHDNCSPSDILSQTIAVVSASAVTVAPDSFVSRAGERFVHLQVEGAAVISSRVGRQGLPTGDDVDLTMRTVLVGPYTRAGAEPETVSELLDSSAPLMLVVYGEIATRQVRPVLRSAGTIDAEGRIVLLGPCGRFMQPSLEAAAEKFGTVVNAEWITRVADPESDEAVAVQQAFLGMEPVDETARFLETPPAERDLTLRNVPRDLRRDYQIVAIVLNVTADTRGGIGFATTAGHSSIIDTSQSPDSVSALLLAPGVTTVELIFFDPDMKQTSLGVVDARLFDAALGSMVTVSQATDGSLSASVAVMEAGELERRLGMTREELEQYRQRLYDF